MSVPPAYIIPTKCAKCPYVRLGPLDWECGLEDVQECPREGILEIDEIFDCPVCGKGTGVLLSDGTKDCVNCRRCQDNNPKPGR